MDASGPQEEHEHVELVLAGLDDVVPTSLRTEASAAKVETQSLGIVLESIIII